MLDPTQLGKATLKLGYALSLGQHTRVKHCADRCLFLFTEQRLGNRHKRTLCRATPCGTCIHTFLLEWLAGFLRPPAIPSILTFSHQTAILPFQP